MASVNRIVVVGASAGGVEALRTLAAALPADFPLPVLVVLHIGRHRSVLPALLSAAGPLKAAHASDGAPLGPGILVAPPDQHMMVVGRQVQLTRGPKVNHARPAIDPLFLSAALAFGSRVVGVVLTGLLDDGTVGMQAIKQCGGLAVVQDPAEALHPSMPLSVQRHAEVDHVVTLAGLAPLLVSLASQPAPRAAPSAQRLHLLQHEQDLLLGKGNPMDHLEALGQPSGYTCPECHGGLWEVADAKPMRLRCHTGHGFTLRTLQHAMSAVADDAVWNALRALQEKGLLLDRMARLHRAAREEPEATELEGAARRVLEQAEQLRGLLERTPDPVE